MITAALTIVLALMYCSGVIYASMWYTGIKSDGEFSIGADGLYKFVQSADDMLVIISIVLLLTVVLLYITSCNKRRNYYISNYVAVGIYAVYAVVCSVLWIYVASMTMAYVGLINFSQWATELQDPANPQYYSEDITTIILGFVIAVINIAEAAVWVYNLIWKIKLMKGEKALLAQGLAKEVA